MNTRTYIGVLGTKNGREVMWEGRNPTVAEILEAAELTFPHLKKEDLEIVSNPFSERCEFWKIILRERPR